jgi:hypothetical protein
MSVHQPTLPEPLNKVQAHRLSHSKTPNLKMMKKNAVFNNLGDKIPDKF